MGGYWAAEGFQLSLSGVWSLSVTVRTSDIEQATSTVKVNIGA
ncbi:hypothetical protein [Streptomyces sp. NPDC055287]